MTDALFNTSPELFRRARQHYSEIRAVLVVVDGHICVFSAKEFGIVARFADDQAAQACLTEAGYSRLASHNIWFPYALNATQTKSLLWDIKGAPNKPTNETKS